MFNTSSIELKAIHQQPYGHLKTIAYEALNTKGNPTHLPAPVHAPYQRTASQMA